MPLGGAILFLEDDDENVGVVITAKNVLMWVNEVI